MSSAKNVLREFKVKCLYDSTSFDDSHIFFCFLKLLLFTFYGWAK